MNQAVFSVLTLSTWLMCTVYNLIHIFVKIASSTGIFQISEKEVGTIKVEEILKTY